MNNEQSDSKSRPSASKADAEGLSSKSHEVAEHVKQATMDRVGTFKQSAQSMRDNAADRVRKLGATVHKVGEHFRIEDQKYVSEHMASISERIDDVADYIGEAELKSLVRDTRAVATRNPGLFLGGALILGIGAGRLLKDTALMGGGMTSTPKPKLSSGGDRGDQEPRGTERKSNKTTASRSEPMRNRASR